MELHLFKTLWGHEGTLDEAIAQARAAGFDGIEGPAPGDAAERSRFGAMLTDAGLDYIGEITTAGSYVPDRQATLQTHLGDFRDKLARIMELGPRFITCLGGCDAWTEAENIAFFGAAMETAAEAGVTVSFETHRGRALFNPWTTSRIVQQLPQIRLTCDYSHWCVVCERLLDSESDVLEQLARHAHHVHARVGYDQGPQVPHPAAPEYAAALHSHQSWWRQIWLAQQQADYGVCTMTPEFGPDGYLQQRPFTREPVADLWELNRWMADEQRRQFSAWCSAR